MLFLLAITLAVSLVHGAPAVCPRGRDSECYDVSDSPIYVSCVSHVCVCHADQGFIGAGTTSDKCRCPAEYSVIDNGGTPYCIKLTDGVAYAQEQRRNALLTGTIRGLYESLIFPSPQLIMGQLITGATQGGIWDLVAPDAVGRVDPLGEFKTKDGIVEYFYGQVWTGASQIQQVVINKLLVDGNKVTVAVDMHFYIYDMFPGGNLLTDYNLTQTGVFTFNDNNQIQSLDLVIHNLGHAVNFFFADHAVEYQRLCEIVIYYAQCDSTMDPDGFYADVPECIAFMESKEFGTWDDIRSDTVSCRQFHAVLAIARPQVHCSHSGKTGGGKCTPHTYSDYYLKQF